MTDYILKRSRRKTLAIQVKGDGKLIVRSPFFLPKFQIENFIRQKQNWIEKKKKEIESNSQKIKEKNFLFGEKFYYLGELYELRFKKNLEDKEKIILNNYFYTSEDKSQKIKKIFFNWYQKEAIWIINDLVLEYASKMKLKPRIIKLSNAKTRWGSCSSNNNLNFNWKLVMAPIDKIEYVVIHELAHIKHKNHSKYFWDYVNQFSLNTNIKRKWFRERENSGYFNF